MFMALSTNIFCQDRCNDSSGSSTTNIPEDFLSTLNIRLAKNVSNCFSPEDNLLIGICCSEYFVVKKICPVSLMHIFYHL